MDDGASVVDDMQQKITDLIIKCEESDDVSCFTTKTTGSAKTQKSKHSVHFSERSVEDDEKLEKALEHDKAARFEVTREDRYRCLLARHGSNSKEQHSAFSHSKSQVRRQCVLCCKTCTDGQTELGNHERTGFKTRMGCRDCFLEAFEHHYNVTVDRADVPKQLKERSVSLCTESRSDNDDALSCFDLWHSAGPLPALHCQAVRSPKRRKKRQKGSRK